MDICKTGIVGQLARGLKMPLFAALFPAMLVSPALASGPGAGADSEHGADNFQYQKVACPFDTSGYDQANLECGYLSVPENRSQAGSRTIRLLVGREKAAGTHPDRAPIIFLQGGPGGSALGMSEHFLQAFHEWFPEHDVIVFDARGTGFSQPALCRWLGLSKRYIGALDRSPVMAEAMANGAERACYDSLREAGVDLSGYNTRENAADVDAIRRALGYRQLNIMAISYGPMLAQAVIKHYPGTVRSAVLYAPLPLDGLGHAEEARVESFGRALRAVFKRCAGSDHCASEWPNLASDFHATVRDLLKKPLSVPVRAPALGLAEYVVNAEDFIGFIQNRMHSSHIATLPATIEAFHRRDVDAVARLIEPTLQGPGYQAQGAFYSSVCRDGPPRHSRWRSLSASWSDLALPGWGNGDIGVCDYWQSGQAEAGEWEMSQSAVPVLLLRGEFDPIITPEDVSSVARHFPNHHTLILPGTGHEPNARSIGCSTAITRQFYENPEREPAAECLDGLAELRFRALDAAAQEAKD